MANNKILTNSELKAKFSTYKLNDLKCPTSNTAKANLPNATMTTKTSLGVTSEGTRLITDAEAKVKVTFKDSSGAHNDEIQDITYGSSATAPDWTRTNYTLSWNKEFSNVKEDTTVTANWILATIPSYNVGFKSIKCSSSMLKLVNTVLANTTLLANNISAPNIDDEFDSDYFSVAKWVTDDANKQELNLTAPITKNVTYCAQILTPAGETIDVMCPQETQLGLWYNTYSSKSNDQILTYGTIDTWMPYDGNRLYQLLDGTPLWPTVNNGIAWYPITNSSGDLLYDTLYLPQPKTYIPAEGESYTENDSFTVKFFIQLQSNGTLGLYVYEYPTSIKVGSDSQAPLNVSLRPIESNSFINFLPVNSSGPSMISVLGKPLAIVLCKVI